MIAFEEAVGKIFDNTIVLGKTMCPVEDAIDRILYDDIVSGIDVVNFRNSAMDGFAVCAKWLSNCSERNQVKLPYSNTVYAGDISGDLFIDSQALKIMTGAPVPDGYDAVVKFEDTSYDDAFVSFCKPISEGANVRLPGEDIKQGQRLFSQNRKIKRLDIGILASLGLDRVEVFKKPSVLIVTTGDELVMPGNKTRFGQIYNSNIFTISSMLRPFAAALDILPAIDDKAKILKETMANKHDIIITSGGVSMGEKDIVKQIAESEGWQTVFHKVKIKPGKPFYFAKRNQQLLFGLPGNPMAAVVTCSVLVMPALKKMTGYTDYKLNIDLAQLKLSTKSNKRLLIWPGTVRKNGKRIITTLTPKKSSGSLTAVLDSDGLIFQTDKMIQEDQNIDNRKTIVFWEEIFN